MPETLFLLPEQSHWQRHAALLHSNWQRVAALQLRPCGPAGRHYAMELHMVHAISADQLPSCKPHCFVVAAVMLQLAPEDADPGPGTGGGNGSAAGRQAHPRSPALDQLLDVLPLSFQVGAPAQLPGLAARQLPGCRRAGVASCLVAPACVRCGAGAGSGAGHGAAGWALRQDTGR
jgi:hypothetical protein